MADPKPQQTILDSKTHQRLRTWISQALRHLADRVQTELSASGDGEELTESFELALPPLSHVCLRVVPATRALDQSALAVTVHSQTPARRGRASVNLEHAAKEELPRRIRVIPAEAVLEWVEQLAASFIAEEPR